MLQPRFYNDSELALGSITINNPYIVNHMHALRLKKGMNCAFFCPHIPVYSIQVNEWHATLEHIDKKYVICNVYACHSIHRCLNYKVNLFLGMIHPSKIEWIVEKATELGINTIYLVSTQHSYHDASKSNSDKQIKRIERLNKIVISACEQCGRNDLLNIEIIDDWAFALNKAERHDINLFLSTKQAKTEIKDTDDKNQTAANIQNTINNVINNNYGNNMAVNCFVGPEGGWSKQEEQDLINKTCKPIYLGSRILRAETACMVIMSYLSTQ
jgi:16S rRNA (uracil1498-N3)-methyltransferase